MATRATEQEVLDILIGVTLTTGQVTPFLTAANLVVTDVLGATTELSNDLKKEIERWYAAHLVMVARGQVKEKSLSKAKVILNRESGLGLDSTTFGQQVQGLDTTGAMAALGKTNVVFSVPDITA